jgi:hypothetical protein
MQHVNNILFPKKVKNICARVTRDPVSGFRVGIAVTYMEKAVLEHFVRRVVTNSIVPIVRTPSTPLESAIPTTETTP